MIYYNIVSGSKWSVIKFLHFVKILWMYYNNVVLRRLLQAVDQSYQTKRKNIILPDKIYRKESGSTYIK